MTSYQHEQNNPKHLKGEEGSTHTPYWMRIHRDWRFWVVLLVMLAAMGTYVTTLNLSWRPRNSVLPLVVPSVK